MAFRVAMHVVATPCPHSSVRPRLRHVPERGRSASSERGKTVPLLSRSSTEFYADGGYQTRIAFVRDAAGTVAGAALNPGRFCSQGQKARLQRAPSSCVAGSARPRSDACTMTQDQYNT